MSFLNSVTRGKPEGMFECPANDPYAGRAVGLEAAQSTRNIPESAGRDDKKILKNRYPGSFGHGKGGERMSVHSLGRISGIA